MLINQSNLPFLNNDRILAATGGQTDLKINRNFIIYILEIMPCLLGGLKITFPTLEEIRIRLLFSEKALVALVSSSKSCHHIQQVKLFNF